MEVRSRIEQTYNTIKAEFLENNCESKCCMIFAPSSLIENYIQNLTIFPEIGRNLHVA